MYDDNDDDMEINDDNNFQQILILGLLDDQGHIAKLKSYKP